MRRLGIDVGGTFTDFVLLDGTDARAWKVPSTPADPALAVLDGIRTQNVALGSLDEIVYGATLGINSVIQRTGARVALFTTKGFEDILEIGWMSKPSMYDLFYQKPRPLVPRRLRVGIVERVLVDGSVATHVDAEEARASLDRLAGESIEAVAIAFINSYSNGGNEDRMAEIVAQAWPGIPISASHAIVNQRREFERTSTAVLNAYVSPAMSEHFRALEDGLRRAGFSGAVYVAQSNGGIMTLEKAISRPVLTLLSGPVGGSAACQAIGSRLMEENLIGLDMGGTSADVSVVLQGKPIEAVEGLVEGFPAMMPVVDIGYIGAGGGSICRIEGSNSLRVGPESAGAVPGPMCYGKGGDKVTVTDADLMLGRLGPDAPYAAGGRLDQTLAESGIEDQLAERLGRGSYEAAEGAIRIAETNMAHAIRARTVARGLDPREMTLVAFGGAGPMHAAAVAKELGIRKVVVPPDPGNLSAWGLLQTDLRFDLSQTVDYAGRVLSATSLAPVLDRLEQEAVAEFQGRDIAGGALLTRRALDMKYAGQEHSLTVPMDEGPVDDVRIQGTIAAFHEMHERAYAHSDSAAEVEVVTARVQLIAEVPKVNGSDETISEESTAGFRVVVFDGRQIDTPVILRRSLVRGGSIPTPAVVVEPGSTTVIPPDFEAHVDEYGDLVLTVPQQTETFVDRTDPILAEVIWNSLQAAAFEMKVDLERTAHSPIINENHDDSVALLNTRAETIANAPGLPEFVCDMPSAVTSVAEIIGGVEKFEPGDIYLTNDPYADTFHVHDVNIIKPVFYDGELFGFACTRAHWHDIGGSSAGGSLNATEIYQEGLQLPAIRLYAKGELNHDIVRIVAANSRLPRAMVGDMQAQVGACRIGERRLLEILDRYGADAVQASARQAFLNGDAVMAEALARFRAGVYEDEALLDNDGVDFSTPLKIRARITIGPHSKPESMTIDVTGSAESCQGPMNANANITRSICRMILKMLTTPNEPANEGHFRRLNVIIPEKSIFNAKKPSATMPGFIALETLVDVVKSALGPALPTGVNAHDYGKCTPTHIKGQTSDGKFFVIPDTEGGGWGAKPFEDGESALRWGEIRIIPIEVLEAKFPVRMCKYSLRTNSGGPGKYRGGLGVVKEYLCLGDFKLNAAMGRQLSPPAGILGGSSSVGNRAVIRRATGEEVLPWLVTDYLVREGEIISLQTSGGGGYGPAAERRREAVIDDLREGLISRDHAEQAYGVKLTSAEAESLETLGE